MSLTRAFVSRFRRLLRPEYWWQPAQLFRRIGRHRLARSKQPVTIDTAWGLPMKVDPCESSGRSLLALNTLDLPVCEAIWRLLDPGEPCADVGANIGSMTSVMAARLRDGGKIWAFEPVPQLTTRLRENVLSWQGTSRAVVSVHGQAVSDRDESAPLFLPADFARDKDLASLATPTHTATGTQVIVDCCTLDRFFEPLAEAPKLLKIDVEGWEAHVLRGAQHLLSHGPIRDVIFEELRPLPAESISLLREHGFTVFRIARGFFRPRLTEAGEPLPFEIDLPSYLATREPARALARFQPMGWSSLRRSGTANR